MINNTKMKVAAKWADKIEEIHSDIDGVWAYTKDGYKFESSDCHTERQDTQKELYKAIQTIVPCDCDECQKATETIEETDDFIDNHIELIFVTDNDEEVVESTPLERPAPLQDEDINDANISAWIGSLGAYNAGHLVGMWVTLPKTDEELNDIVHRVNTAATLATLEPQEETEVFDLNVTVSGLYNGLHRLGLHEINEVAETLEELEAYEIDNVGTIMEIVGNVKESVEMVEECIILDDVKNAGELGEALHEAGFLSLHIPDELENYIDFEAIGRDYICSGAFTLTSTGEAVNLPK